MNGKTEALRNIEYLISNFVRAVKDSSNDYYGDLSLILNLLYRVKYNLPFLVSDNGEFLSDNLESVEDPVLLPLNDAYKEPRVFDLICSTFKELCAIDHEEFLEVYADAIDYASNRYSTIGDFRVSAQPKELTQLICDFIEEKSCKSIYNPFAGIASYTGFLKTVNYYCQDNNPYYRMVGRIRMDAYHNYTSKYLLGDCFSEWNDHDADCIVATFPHGDLNKSESGRKSYFDFIIDAFLLSKAKYAYLVISPDVTFLHSYRYIRKQIVKRGLLEMVISLPDRLFATTGISHTLVVLNKENISRKVLFADASELAERIRQSNILNVSDTLNLIKSQYADNRVEVDVDIISERDYQWYPGFYISEAVNQIPSGFDSVTISDILDFIPDQNSFTEKSGRVVGISDFDIDDMSFIKDPSSFPLKDDLKFSSRIDEPVLLVSDYFGKIKPLYIQASKESPVFIKNRIRAFRLTNQWVDPSYLCLELSRIASSLHTSSMRMGRHTLSLLKIALPQEASQKGLDEQRRIFNEALDAFKLSKAKEMGLMEIIEKMKKDYMNTVRERKHNMKTPMTEIRNTLYLLNKFADKVPGESSERFNALIMRVEKSLDRLSSYVSHLADEQVFGDPEPINLDELLSKETREEANYVVKYQRDDTAFDLADIKKPLVMMGRTDAMSMVQNIVDNAINHGFDDFSEKYTLTINLTIEDEYYIIEFVNNGKPLPEGINKDRYGIEGVKSGDSKGSGIGGYVVKSISEHYGGDYDIFSRDTAGEMLTYVIIKLPIYLDNE